jgi:hypothetical protein
VTYPDSRSAVTHPLRGDIDDQRNAAPAATGMPDEEDFDLLTHGVAGERLVREIARARADLADATEDGPQRAKLETRLAQLLDAQQRNARPEGGPASFASLFLERS